MPKQGSEELEERLRAEAFNMVKDYIDRVVVVDNGALSGEMIYKAFHPRLATVICLGEDTRMEDGYFDTWVIVRLHKNSVDGVIAEDGILYIDGPSWQNGEWVWEGFKLWDRFNPDEHAPYLPRPGKAVAAIIDELSDASLRLEDHRRKLEAGERRLGVEPVGYGLSCAQADDLVSWYRAADAVCRAAKRWLAHLEAKGARYQDGVPGELMDAMERLEKLE